MRLEQRERELAAIGASIGADCRPCIEHHLPPGREAGLSELVALGASGGANSHPLLDLHIATAREAGLSSTEIEAALKTAEYVQERAAEMTAKKATHELEERGGASVNTAAAN